MSIEDTRGRLKESVEYFSSQNKRERDGWVCDSFLKKLGVKFDPRELLPQTDDPPDVIFRDARFEVKEILDPGRRRHDEYKEALARAMKAKNPAELMEGLTPVDITPVQIGGLIVEKLSNLVNSYEPRFRETLDVLFYVNRMKDFLTAGPMSAQDLFSPFGWRSVSAVTASASFVFFAAPGAPDFLAAKVGVSPTP